MVTTIGILGSGFFGAGMRAVQEREENILRRYKVTPITPVPLLLASVTMGVILYLPTVALMLFLAHKLYGMPIPAKSVFAFPLRLLWFAGLSSPRPHHRRGREFFTGGERSDPDRLHANAPAEWRDFPAFVYAELAANRHPIHSSELPRHRHVGNSPAR